MLWERVNEIATTTEDAALIRKLIGEAGIEPGMHVGRGSEAFDDDMTAEWALGQWADAIDNDSPWLNTIRNISLSQYDKVYVVPYIGPLP
jgi:hypothetical protein